MRVKFVQEEDFLNYRKPSMFIGSCFCTFKCEKENPRCHCQNSPLAHSPIMSIKNSDIVERYLKNDITKAIVIGGLEPFEQFDELTDLIYEFRLRTDDDIVIYTGWKKSEIENEVNILKHFKNIIIKFGRFVPGSVSVYDEVLGVVLASLNQYGEKIS